GAGVVVLSLDDIPPLEFPPEQGATFEENALAKARFVSMRSNLPALADDSGLEVDCLGGRPGVYSARYAGAGATDEENYLKLLKELEGVPEGKRGARFRSVVAFVSPGGAEATFDGVFEGVIAKAPRGSGGFGYDPVFFVPEAEKTAAEMSEEEKNAISHRGKALKKLKNWLLRNR
ncbi:MAG: RdgB/HAM1 family non-canonical purine NTP pyrophosphatase, partial [Deltaproteobacteria bacterium]|nr:RdgB/HAM1 family non-canonical purine NTP pyrophosphatase [Deltaproteobacteria bacterium]